MSALKAAISYDAYTAYERRLRAGLPIEGEAPAEAVLATLRMRYGSAMQEPALQAIAASALEIVQIEADLAQQRSKV